MSDLHMLTIVPLCPSMVKKLPLSPVISSVHPYTTLHIPPSPSSSPRLSPLPPTPILLLLLPLLSALFTVVDDRRAATRLSKPVDCPPARPSVRPSVPPRPRSEGSVHWHRHRRPRARRSIHPLQLTGRSRAYREHLVGIMSSLIFSLLENTFLISTIL